MISIAGVEQAESTRPPTTSTRAIIRLIATPLLGRRHRPVGGRNIKHTRPAYRIRGFGGLMLTPLRRDWVRPDYRILDRDDQAAGASQRHYQGFYFRGFMPDPREYRILLPAGNPPAGCVSSPRTDPVEPSRKRTIICKLLIKPHLSILGLYLVCRSSILAAQAFQLTSTKLVDNSVDNSDGGPLSARTIAGLY